MTIDASNVQITTTAEEGTDLVTRDANGNIIASVPLPPDRVNAKSLETRIETALTNNATFLALASPTNAQTLAQVRALTRQMNAVARLIAGKLDTTDGT